MSAMKNKEDNVIGFAVRQKNAFYSDLEPLKPTWEISINNFAIQLFNPIPNRFQRWMLKKCFNLEVIVYKAKNETNK